MPRTRWPCSQAKSGSAWGGGPSLVRGKGWPPASRWCGCRGSATSTTLTRWPPSLACWSGACGRPRRAGRRGSRRPALIPGHGGRPGLAARARAGRGDRRAGPARRAGPRHLWRLPDARGRDRSTRWNRAAGPHRRARGAAGPWSGSRRSSLLGLLRLPAWRSARRWPGTRSTTASPRSPIPPLRNSSPGAGSARCGGPAGTACWRTTAQAGVPGRGGGWLLATFTPAPDTDSRRAPAGPAGRASAIWWPVTWTPPRWATVIL